MYKLEGHLHTLGNSQCARVAPEEIVPLYKKEGYDGIVCTNHYSRFILDNYLSGSKEEKTEAFLAGYRKLKSLANKENTDVFFGLEAVLEGDDYHYRTKLDCAEILVYGITEDEFLKYTESIANETYEGLKRLADENGWLLVQAHPYRERTKRIAPEYLHGIEVTNGHPLHISRNGFARRRAEKYGLYMTGGSDFHFIGGQGSGMFLPRRPEDEKDLAKLIREGNNDFFGKK